jgi:leucyl-tRNA synthetase
LLSPFAPHIAEELWQILGHDQTLAYEPWPSYDEAMLKSDTIEIPVQINGKVRETITVPAECGQDEMIAAAKANARIAELIADKTMVKQVVVPKRLVNFVVK